MREPRPYQHQVATRASERDLYIAFQCGLGKSLTAVEAVKNMKKADAINSHAVLILVSPKVALEQWKREIEVQDPGVPVFLVSAEDPFCAVDAPDSCYVVTYYETLLDAEINKFTLSARTWGVIVADEAHKCKNRDAKRTKALFRLHSERRIAMSGTPFEKSPAELWSILHWFDRKRFSSFWQFANTYIQQVEAYRGTEFVGVRPDMRDELATMLREYMVIRTRKQVGQYITKLVSVQRVTLDVEQRALYDKVRKADDVVVDIGVGELLFLANQPATMTRLSQLASWPGLLDRTDLPSAKFDWVMEYIANNPNEPMLIFTRFRDSAVELHRRIEAGEGLRAPTEAGLVIGAQLPYKLTEVLDGRVKLLVGTIAALGTAIDLPMLSTAIFVEMEWSSVLMRQAADRIHRMTTTAPPNIIFLLALRTIDGLMLKRFTQKLSDQRTFELMLGQPDDPDDFDDDTKVAEALE